MLQNAMHSWNLFGPNSHKCIFVFFELNQKLFFFFFGVDFRVTQNTKMWIDATTESNDPNSILFKDNKIVEYFATVRYFSCKTIDFNPIEFLPEDDYLNSLNVFYSKISEKLFAKKKGGMLSGTIYSSTSYKVYSSLTQIIFLCATTAFMFHYEFKQKKPFNYSHTSFRFLNYSNHSDNTSNNANKTVL